MIASRRSRPRVSHGGLRRGRRVEPLAFDSQQPVQSMLLSQERRIVAIASPGQVAPQGQAIAKAAVDRVAEAAHGVCCPTLQRGQFRFAEHDRDARLVAQQSGHPRVALHGAIDLGHRLARTARLHLQVGDPECGASRSGLSTIARRTHARTPAGQPC